MGARGGLAVAAAAYSPYTQDSGCCVGVRFARSKKKLVRLKKPRLPSALGLIQKKVNERCVCFVFGAVVVVSPPGSLVYVSLFAICFFTAQRACAGSAPVRARLVWHCTHYRLLCELLFGCMRARSALRSSARAGPAERSPRCSLYLYLQSRQQAAPARVQSKPYMGVPMLQAPAGMVDYFFSVGGVGWGKGGRAEGLCVLGGVCFSRDFPPCGTHADERYIAHKPGKKNDAAIYVYNCNYHTGTTHC
eukprot:scaffold1290_cov115-Isochrysis_galbana.AAC.11